MTITFADGTQIDVAASALDDFVRHDLKWVEFVHGRASKPFQNSVSMVAQAVSKSVQRCPSHMFNQGCSDRAA